MRPSIRFGDKERGLRGLVKLLFDARRARQKVWEAKARSKWVHVKKGNEINSHARSENLVDAKDLVPTLNSMRQNNNKKIRKQPRNSSIGGTVLSRLRGPKSRAISAEIPFAT